MAEIKISVTEYTVIAGKTDSISLKIDGVDVKIDVPVEIKAYFNEQFVRPNPTPQQKKRYATLMTLMRAAYQAGQKSTKK